MSGGENKVLDLFQRNRDLMSRRKIQRSRSQQMVWEPSVGWLTPSERTLLEEEENDCLPEGYRTVDERKRGYRLTQTKFKEYQDGRKTTG
jgi:hypothetical protein